MRFSRSKRQTRIVFSPPEWLQLEPRQLLSGAPVELEVIDDVLDLMPIQHAPLSAGVTRNGTEGPLPVALGLGTRADGEDANNIVFKLDDYFVDAIDKDLAFEVINNSNPKLFDAVFIDRSRGVPNLTLDVAADATGDARITIRATNDAGSFVDDTLQLSLLPVNDRPTTTGLLDIRVEAGTRSTVIDLFAAFNDREDADPQLTYTITQNTNPSLFSSIEVDALRGTMTFHYALNAHGSSQITIRATDTQGSYVEMSTAGGDFPVYDWLFGQPGVHYPDLQFDGMDIIANHWLFPSVDGQYQFDQFDEVRLRTYLRTLPESANFVFNIENDYYENTPEGRDRFAEVFSVVHDERPDIVDFGVYRIMPEGSFYIPYLWHRAQEDAGRGVSSYFANNYKLFRDRNQAWEARNDLFRTQPVSPQFGGRPLAEMVGLIIPSLYTSYRNDPAHLESMIFELDIDTAHSSFSLRDELVYEGMHVRIAAGIGASLPQGLVSLQDYYVVNATETSFQLAPRIGGTPIELLGAAQGDFFAAPIDQRFIEHDPAVRYWEAYARGNILEARQYNHTVLPWLSPSLAGVGQEYVDKNFFRMQLDLMFELGDGIGLYDEGTSAGARLENRGWWDALEEFMQYIHTPTQFTITVEPPMEAVVEQLAGRAGNADTGQPLVGRWDAMRAALSGAQRFGPDLAIVSSATSNSVAMGSAPPGMLATYRRTLFIGSSFQRSDLGSVATASSSGAADRFAAFVGSTWARWDESLRKY